MLKNVKQLGVQELLRVFSSARESQTTVMQFFFNKALIMFLMEDIDAV